MNIVQKSTGAQASSCVSFTSRNNSVIKVLTAAPFSLVYVLVPVPICPHRTSCSTCQVLLLSLPPTPRHSLSLTSPIIPSFRLMRSIYLTRRLYPSPFITLLFHVFSLPSPKPDINLVSLSRQYTGPYPPLLPSLNSRSLPCSTSQPRTPF